MKELKIVEYREEFGKIHLSDDFINQLKGKSYEEQLKYYAFSEISGFEDVPYYEFNNHLKEYPHRIQFLSEIDTDKIVVKDGIIVGVVVFNSHIILPYERFIYLTTSDNNGSDYKETDWYKYLICVPSNHPAFSS